MEQQPLLPDFSDNRFESALEKFGIWPTTVWDVDYSDALTQRLKRWIGDLSDWGMVRQDVGKSKSYHRIGASGTVRKNLQATQSSGTNSCYGKEGAQFHVSVFNPAIAAWALNCFAPEEGTCYDPFAGGGTRAIMAAKHGLRYVGCEIRQEECEAVEARLRANEVDGDRAQIHCRDARDAAAYIAHGTADFLLTCPPYYNLEMYDGGEADLSMAPTYRDFLDGLERSILAAHAILKPGSLACWIIGIFRDSTTGTLIPFHHDVARLHQQHGYLMKEEVVLAHKNNGAIQRVGNFSKGNHYLVRTHEYLQVYVRD